jgi:flagellar biosynthesis protein FlhF
MKVKRYIVKDMNEAMIKIKSDLGMDAIILNTRRIKNGGFFKLFKKPMLEVVAAVDEPARSTKTPLKPPIEEPQPKPETAPATGTVKEREEIAALKDMVATLIQKVEGIERNQLRPILEAEASREITESPDKKYIQMLMELGIQESIAKKILEIVQRQISISDKNHEAVINAIKVIAREYLGEIKTIDTDSASHPNIYMFLGPTGVGKTTTLAKIAARLSLVENKKIGLITADTYRIAAVEQLKTYSEILGIPLEVIYEASELSDAINRFKDKDYILIDTAGRSHKSKELKSDYDELIQHLPAATVFLVMSLTTDTKNLKSIIDSYQFLDDYRLLFTKLDESTSYGNILNMRVITGKSLSYFTIGQSVPDDIEVADKEKIIHYIFEEKK